MPVPLVLSLKEASKRVDQTETMLRREIREGRLHPLHGVSQIRITKTELSRWKKDREQGERFPVSHVVDRPTVYRLEDRKGRTLYVGVTNNLGRRLAIHSRVQPWWDDVAHVTVRYFRTRAAAEVAEGEAIVLETPVHNKQTPGVGWDKKRRIEEEAWMALTGGGELDRDQAIAT